MDANTRHMADAVSSALAGNLTAQRAVSAIRSGGVLDPDHLYNELALVLSHDQPNRLRGFMREIQKTIERGQA